jgi:SPFH domain / Band 7 family
LKFATLTTLHYLLRHNHAPLGCDCFPLSPLVVSGIVTYEVVDSRRAAIDVPSAHQYVLTQAPAVLKRVISQFPYDSDNPDLPCLRKEPQAVSALMKETLQDRVKVAGVRIESFAINELSYAPEIAHSMLRRQQAGALIEARQVRSVLRLRYLPARKVLSRRFFCTHILFVLHTLLYLLTQHHYVTT